MISGLRYALAVFLLVWYAVILVVAYNGFLCILRKFRLPPTSTLGTAKPVTIIRPIKGIDPELSSCLESSFLQNYPGPIQILFCIDDPSDVSIPVIKALIAKYPHIDADILISSQDPATDASSQHFGPNPKVNNLAKGYLAAKHDILWIMDSNVWASPNILANSVKSLVNNTNNGKKLLDWRRVKLVHHVPLALSISSSSATDSEYVFSPIGSRSALPSARSLSPEFRKRLLKKYGAQLDEMFLMTSHSKFYVSLNNLAIAPCVNGKSNLYRRSDLDAAVAAMPSQLSPFFDTKSVKSDANYYSSLGPGNALKLFARYIGEDNMIGIALWEFMNGRTGLTGDFVLQPLSGVDNSINDYMTRRVRWLRVRKYMVLAATLVEPTTESIICGIFGTYGLSTLIWHQWFNWKFFAFHMVVWMLTDYVQYHTWVNNIASARYSVPWLASLPPLNRPFWQWLRVWVMREVLALPIWVTAMVGHEIDWRGRPFKIKKDLTAEEL